MERKETQMDLGLGAEYKDFSKLTMAEMREMAEDIVEKQQKGEPLSKRQEEYLEWMSPESEKKRLDKRRKNK